MVTVGADTGGVEAMLGAGRLACPECSGRLTAWGWGRPRTLRGPGQALPLRPRRTRCSGCLRTHILLPATVLLRRADQVVVIGAGLELAATGHGHRRVAALLDRPASTVRGWLRRLAGRAERVAARFTSWLVALVDDPARALPSPAGTPLGDAVAAMIGFVHAVRARFSVPTAPIWPVVSAACHGQLLTPGWPAANG